LKRLLVLVVLLITLISGTAFANSQKGQQANAEAAWREAEKVHVPGPAEITLGDQAKLKLPQGYVYIPATQAANLLKSIGNSTDSSLLGMVLSPNDDEDWFVTIHYEKSGFIKDDDAKNWNIDELLESYKEGTKEGNKERVKKGFPELEVLGWVEKPKYDSAKKHLVWSMSVLSKGDNSDNYTVNYNTYVLGREGYITMNLVTGIKEIEKDKPAAAELLAGTEFLPGKKYEEYNSNTDKVAEYGLAALIGGVAAKKLGLLAIVTGFAAKFIKVIIVAVIAGGGGLFAVFRRKKKDNTPPPDSPDIKQ
jgi:uncharacterized membrane-anchored protein